MCIRNYKIKVKVMSIHLKKIKYGYAMHLICFPRDKNRTDTAVKYVKDEPISAVLFLPCLYICKIFLLLMKILTCN